MSQDQIFFETGSKWVAVSSDLYAPHIWEGMLHTLTTPNHGLVLRVLIEKKIALTILIQIINSVYME